MAGNGFTANTTRMRSTSAKLVDGGDSAAAARDVLASTPVPVHAFGLSERGRGIAAGIEKAVSRQAEQLATRIGRLEELAGKLNASADEYDRMSASGTDSFTGLDESRAKTTSRITGALEHVDGGA